MLRLIIPLIVSLVPLVSSAHNSDDFYEKKVRIMRITAYIPSNSKGALGTKIRTGATAAVSRECMDLLGENIYIEGFGTRHVNDVTASWLDKKFDVCTIDLAVPNMTEAKKIGCSKRKVVRLTNYGK